MDFITRQTLIRPLIRKFLGPVPIDAICYTSEEYEKSKHGFLGEIIEKEGLMI